MANYPSIDSELLRTFVAIADHGGFTRAAEMVNRTQSAVSMQMKRLEEDVMQRPLFQREGRQFSLTAEGQLLLSYARRILKLHAEVMNSMREPDMVGTVRIGTPDDYVMRFMQGVLVRFADAYPLVQVELHCEPSFQLLQRQDLDPTTAPGTPGLGPGPRQQPAHAEHAAVGDVQLPLFLPFLGLQRPGRHGARIPHRLHQPQPVGDHGRGQRRSGDHRATAKPDHRGPGDHRRGARPAEHAHGQYRAAAQRQHPIPGHRDLGRTDRRSLQILSPSSTVQNSRKPTNNRRSLGSGNAWARRTPQLMLSKPPNARGAARAQST